MSVASEKIITVGNQKLQLINMFILAVAIILVCVAKSRFYELFVASLPEPPFYQGYGAGGNSRESLLQLQVPGTQPQGNPYIYQNQVYPGRIPYYNELGRPCAQGQDSCGSVGKCENGKCAAIPYSRTAFNVDI